MERGGDPYAWIASQHTLPKEEASIGKAYTVIRSLEEFAAARGQFNFLVSRLQAAEMSRMEHGEVEATIAQEGTELLRHLWGNNPMPV